MPAQGGSGAGFSVGRRAVLGGVAAAGVGVSVGLDRAFAASPAASGAGGVVPVTQQRERAVVVGSGFGGGVTALRLAAAGVLTLVVERGIWWPTGPNSSTFPRIADIDHRAVWLNDQANLPAPAPMVTAPSGKWKPFTGLIESRVENGMTIAMGAGVGGGSLVYQGMTLQPREEWFAASMPRMAVDYQNLDQVYYPMVAKMLQLETLPDDLLALDQYKSSRLFLDVAGKAGLQTFRTPLPVNWFFARGEVKGWFKPTYTNSDLALGVDNGGKHSIDVTYLAAALATGRVRVATLHLVRDVSLDAQRRWVLHVDVIDTGGVVRERKEITADAVFLNAGSAGTTRLLVKAKAKGLIPDLPDAVGTGWGNNGDQVYTWISPNGDPGSVQGGPAPVGGFDLQSRIPQTIIHAGIPEEVPFGLKMVTLVGMGVVPGVGTWAYNADKDDATLTWPKDGDAALQASIRARMDDFTRIGGGFLVDTNAALPSTAHGLGGVPMFDAVDKFGRVLGHRGLYVLDGARIPGSTGACNPSMTIAALAEHSMATIVRQDVGVVF